MGVLSVFVHVKSENKTYLRQCHSEMESLREAGHSLGPNFTFATRRLSKLIE